MDTYTFQITHEAIVHTRTDTGESWPRDGEMDMSFGSFVINYSVGFSLPTLYPSPVRNRRFGCNDIVAHGPFVSLGLDFFVSQS